MWQWYETAAVQGDARAQTNFGVRYRTDRGCQKTLCERIYIMRYSLAATHSPGDAQRAAAKHRTLIARLMASAQIADAKKPAREWIPKPP